MRKTFLGKIASLLRLTIWIDERQYGVRPCLDKLETPDLEPAI